MERNREAKSIGRRCCRRKRAGIFLLILKCNGRSNPVSVLEHTLGREGVWTELSEDTGSMHLWESVDHTLHDVVRVCSLSLIFALQLYLDNLRVLPDSKLRVPHSRSGRDDVIAKRASA